METTASKKRLNSNQIKLIAIIAMTIDHLTWVFFPGCQYIWFVYILHIIGRLTAPIMWFFIAEGCHYTHNKRAYVGRLFIFAVISHFAYDFAFGIPFFSLSAGPFNRTSVMWSLTIAAVVIFACQSESTPTWAKYVIIFAGCIVAFPSDWSSIAVMAPFFIFAHRGNFKKQAVSIVFWSFVYALVYFIFLDKVYGIIQMFTFISIPVLSQYNGECGKWQDMKWLFYIYYPAHLVIIGILRIIVQGNVALIF